MHCFKICFRYDNVEFRLEGDINHPAKVRYFIKCLVTGKMYALVQWYKMDKWKNRAYKDGFTRFHPIFQVPHCKLMSISEEDSYDLMDVDNITGHAHMVTDFESPGYFWWDLVSQERLTYEELAYI